MEEYLRKHRLYATALRKTGSADWYDNTDMALAIMNGLPADCHWHGVGSTFIYMHMWKADDQPDNEELYKDLFKGETRSQLTKQWTWTTVWDSM